MTRATVALARGDYASAWGQHPFVFLLAPLAVAVAFWPGGTRAAWARTPRLLRRLFVGLALLACVGLWLSRVALG